MPTDKPVNIHTPLSFDAFQVVVPVVDYLKRRRDNLAALEVEYRRYPSARDYYTLDNAIAALHAFHSKRIDHAGRPLPELLCDLPQLIPVRPVKRRGVIVDVEELPEFRLDLGWTFIDLIDILPEERIKASIPASDGEHVDVFQKEEFFNVFDQLEDDSSDEED